jgi:hypothetical protein
MAKKKKGFEIPVITIIGLTATVLMGYLFGGLMVLRYMLGAIMFGTITLKLVNWNNKKFGKKKIRLW